MGCVVLVHVNLETSVQGVSEALACLQCYAARLIVTSVPGQLVSPIFKGKAIQGDLDCMTLEDGCDRLSQNIGN